MYKITKRFKKLDCVQGFKTKYRFFECCAAYHLGTQKTLNYAKTLGSHLLDY